MDSAIYPRQAFRLGCDVDLLVRPEDFDRADDVLTGLAENIEKTSGKPATTAFAIEKTFVVSPIFVVREYLGVGEVLLLLCWG